MHGLLTSVGGQQSPTSSADPEKGVSHGAKVGTGSSRCTEAVASTFHQPSRPNHMGLSASSQLFYPDADLPRERTDIPSLYVDRAENTAFTFPPRYKSFKRVENSLLSLSDHRVLT